MTKELEYIQRQIDIVKQQVKGSKMKIIVTDVVTKHQYDYYERELQTLESIEKSLNRLESIDNANPSEALECLEKLKDMEISSMPFSDECGTQEVDLNDIRKVGSQLNTDFREYTNTIKQALLKAQEPKQYLKWEDLEFNHKAVFTEAKLGETIYDLVIGFDCTGKETIFLRTDNQQIVFHEKDKQFFNDLHLERVE